MISRFKLKKQVTTGIDVESPSDQANEISSMIGAQSFSVDIFAGTATFIVNDEPITAGVGQVVSITAGVISVQSSEEFYEMYETDHWI